MLCRLPADRAAPAVVGSDRRTVFTVRLIAPVLLSMSLLIAGCNQPPDKPPSAVDPPAADGPRADADPTGPPETGPPETGPPETGETGPPETGPPETGPPEKNSDPAQPTTQLSAPDDASGAGSGDQNSTAKKEHRNRLADETSPYLLLHAHNPVDWYPWGEEALAKARKENKLIFLSVGYSSCHWCHVMERESFTDDEIAALLNKHFVCIKVDREERPDVDNIHMTAVQLLTGRGGWPMSVFLTPDARPFFGGTYFPARDDDRPGMPGFLSILKAMQRLWKEEPDAIKSDATRLTDAVKQHLDGRRPRALQPLDAKWLEQVQAELAGSYDEQYGGFGYNALQPMRPKFPEPSNLVFLVDRMRRLPEGSEQRKEAEQLLVGTLQGMALGGIRDHLGGGFHRYSVDRFWRIPHFEKMLYDNGQLATVYAEAFALTGDEAMRQVVDEMIAFVLREMTDEQGGFYSALDAESEDVEGKFYRWEKDEVSQLLSEPEMELFSALYGLDQDPNFEEEYYAPQLSKPLAETAKARGISREELEAQLRPIRAKLLAARDKRPRPLTDTKILTSWNGLMIRGLADAGRLLERPEYIEAAARAANFVLTNLRDEQGRLKRTFSGGKPRLNAYLDDYAFLVDGLIGLHQATGEQRWLDEADALTAIQLDQYWDDKNLGFFFTGKDHESLLARGKNPVDGARPSGNSVAAANLVYLGQKLDKPDYFKRAQQTIDSASGLIYSNPTMAPRLATVIAELPPEPAKPEPAKPEPAKPEPAKPEPAKPEPEQD